MIKGAHVILYSSDADADRAFFRNELGWDHVDAGDGWLIFRMPPAEVAVHPSGGHTGRDPAPGSDTPAELYLVCDDVAAVRQRLIDRGVACSEVKDEGWGILTALTLPGGTTLGLYEPRHPTAF